MQKKARPSIINFRWAEAGLLAGSSKPFYSQDVEFVVGKGFKAIVSLEAMHPGIRNMFKRMGFELLTLPVRENSIPTKAQLQKFFEFVDRMKRQGKPVLVHCSAGTGRTPCLLQAYLIRGELRRGRRIRMLKIFDRTGYSGRSQKQADFPFKFQKEMLRRRRRR